MEADSLPKSRRPVCYSLYKYSGGQAGPDEQIATQAEPGRESWKKKEADSQRSLEEAVAEALDSQVVSVGEVQAVVAKPGRNFRGGRPKQGLGEQKRGKYKNLTGQQKVWVCQEMAARVHVPGVSKSRLYHDLAAKFGCVWQSIRRLWMQKDFWLNWGQKENRPAAVTKGSFRRKGERHSSKAGRGASMGCRIAVGGGRLGRKNHCELMHQQVQVWAEVEQENGHEISRQCLLRQFRLFLSSAIHKADDEQRAGTLTPEAAELLTHWKKKQFQLDNSAKARENAAIFLVGKTGFAERKKQRTTAMTVEEEIQLCQEGWANFDHLLWKTGCAEAPVLKAFVAQPERFVLNRQNTVISMSD